MTSGGLRRYDDWPQKGMVTWWWWLEFDDRTTSASGRETRDAAIADAKRRARERGVVIELDPSAAGAFVERDALAEVDPQPEERDDERDVAEDARDHAGEHRDDHRQDEG